MACPASAALGAYPRLSPGSRGCLLAVVVVLLASNVPNLAGSTTTEPPASSTAADVELAISRSTSVSDILRVVVEVLQITPTRVTLRSLAGQLITIRIRGEGSTTADNFVQQLKDMAAKGNAILREAGIRAVGGVPVAGAASAGQCEPTVTINSVPKSYLHCCQCPLSDTSIGLTLHWSVVSDNAVEVALRGGWPAADWLGFGFSKSDGQMVGSYAILAWQAADGRATTGSFYLGGQISSAVVAQRFSSNETGARLVSGTLASSISHGVTVLTATFVFPNPKTLSSSIGIIWAAGPMNPAEVFPLQHDAGNSAASAVNFKEGTCGFVVGDHQLGKKQAHGWCMGLAWGVFLPAGALVARFGKHWPKWLQLHTVLQTTGVIFTLIGFALAIDFGTGNEKTHRTLGVVITTIVVAQLAIAVLLRPRPKSSYYSYFYLQHLWTGRLLLLLGTANIFVGMGILNPARAYKVLLILACVLCLIIWGALEFQWLRTRPRRKIDSAHDRRLYNMRNPLYSPTDPMFSFEEDSFTLGADTDT